MSIRKAAPILAAALLSFSSLLFLATPSFASDNVTVSVTVEQNVTVEQTAGSPSTYSSCASCASYTPDTSHPLYTVCAGDASPTTTSYRLRLATPIQMVHSRFPPCDSGRATAIYDPACSDRGSGRTPDTDRSGAGDQLIFS